MTVSFIFIIYLLTFHGGAPNIGERANVLNKELAAQTLYFFTPRQWEEDK